MWFDIRIYKRVRLGGEGRGNLGVPLSCGNGRGTMEEGKWGLGIGIVSWMVSWAEGSIGIGHVGQAGVGSFAVGVFVDIQRGGKVGRDRLSGVGERRNNNI